MIIKSKFNGSAYAGLIIATLYPIILLLVLAKPSFDSKDKMTFFWVLFGFGFLA
jgi:hypothetical protein